jgi:lysozyme family protein
VSVVDDIIRREGKEYTNRPDDKGGPTKFGITLAMLREWRKMPMLTAWDVEHMEEAEARDIYRVKFIAPWGFIVNPQLRDFLIDSGVNHGVERAVKFLQRALGVKDDGDVGSTTRTALANVDGETLRLRTIAERMKFYGRLVDADHTQAVYIEGWLNRLAEFLY